MKKKTIGIICILLIVLACISFIGYKVYLLNAYNTKEFDNNYLYFLDILKKKDTYTIKNNNKQISDYLKYDKLKIGTDYANMISKNEKEMVKQVKEIIKKKMSPKKIDLEKLQQERMKKLEKLFDGVI